ncbi:MAG: PAS domain S-box protein, partial [Chloroflexota bacterium]|nr:PAS domain S-box protein [Chloroflexota bacterium]
RYIKDISPKYPGDFFAQAIDLFDISTVILAPIIVNEEILGLLIVESDDLVSSDCSAIRSLAYLIAAAWQKTTLLMELSRNLEERKRAEERFRSIFENAVMGLYRTNLDGEFMMANPALVQMIGYDSFAELDEHSITDQGILEAEVRNNFLQLIERDGQMLGFETTWRRKDGSEIFIRENAKAIRSANGDTLYYEGAVEDITERVQAKAKTQQVLRDLEHVNLQLQAAIDISKSVSTILTPQRLMEAVVDGIKENFGLYYVGLFLLDEAGQQAVLQAGTGKAGKELLDARHSLDIDDQSMIGWCIAQRRSRIAQDAAQDDVRFANPYLPETRSELALPLISQEQCLGALTVQSVHAQAFLEQDITVLEAMADQLAIAVDNAQLYATAQREIKERQQAEEALRILNEELENRVIERTHQLEVTMEELKSFSYSVSHDLRAPLRRIDGFSQALLDDYADQLDETGAHYLQRVRCSTQLMGQLINDILQLSRVTRAELKREDVDLAAMSREIMAGLRQIEPKRRVTFSAPESIAAHADRRLLRIVLENLLGNAWKFTSKKEEAHIEIKAIYQENAPARYCISDNGAGFDSKYAHKLFVAFQRLHTPSEFQGTGVGLATVKRIILRHNGRIWAESEIKQGTSFHFTLRSDGVNHE